MTRDDDVEIELENLVQHLDPLDSARAIGIVHYRHPFGDQIPGVNDLQVGEVDHGVAVGVSAPEIVRADFHAAQENGSLVVEHDPWSTRLFVSQKILSHVFVRDDLGHLDEALVAAGVVRMMVGIQQVLHRL